MKTSDERLNKVGLVVILVKENGHFELKHASLDYDWFLETTDYGNGNYKKTAVIITYYNDTPDVAKGRYGKVKSILKGTNLYYPTAGGQKSIPYNYKPSPFMEDFMDAAIEAHAGKPKESIYLEFINFYFSPSGKLGPLEKALGGKEKKCTLCGAGSPHN